MAYKNKEDTIRYNNNFTQENYDRINLTLPKGQKAKVKSEAEDQAESVNCYISKAIALRANLTWYLKDAITVPGTDDRTRQAVSEVVSYFLDKNRFPIAQAETLPDSEPEIEDAVDEP